MSRSAGVLITTLLGATITAAATFNSQVASSQQANSLQGADDTFQARCSTCHAEHGEGSEVGASLNVPDLRSQRIQGQDDDTLRRIIKEGKGDMPTFKRDFTDDEVNQLVKLVRSFARKNDHGQTQAPSNEGGHKSI